jgi:hypothetical protein
VGLKNCDNGQILKYRTNLTPNWYCTADIDTDTKYDTEIAEINSKISGLKSGYKVVSGVIRLNAAGNVFTANQGNSGNYCYDESALIKFSQFDPNFSGFSEIPTVTATLVGHFNGFAVEGVSVTELYSDSLRVSPYAVNQSYRSCSILYENLHPSVHFIAYGR